MTPLEIVKFVQNAGLMSKNGSRVQLKLMPGLSSEELDEFEGTLPCRIPPQVRELLSYCRGFAGVWDGVDLTGGLEFEFEPAFPHGLPIVADGFGNFWVVDLHADSTDWAPIYFACHDAPIILYQCDSLAGFLTELFKMYSPPFTSEIDEVHEDRPARVWATNPGVLSYESCLASPDTVLSDFAAQLDPDFQIVDLRKAKPGDGFSWGRYGPDTEVRRYGKLPVFAYRKPLKPRGILQRLFGR